METPKDREEYDALFKKCIQELTPLTIAQMYGKVFNWYLNNRISMKMSYELNRYIKDTYT